MLFVEFYFNLRAFKIPVSITEFLTFIEACDRGLIHDLDSLYFVGRSLLIKDERYFDLFDELFLKSFRGIDNGGQVDLQRELRDFLEIPPELLELDSDMKEHQEYEKLRRPESGDDTYNQVMVTPPMDEQGIGNQFGQGGAGNQGSGGQSAAGIRVGGASSSKMAMAVAGDRKFKNLRHDLVLDTRYFQVALKKLRELKKAGAVTELDLDKTVDQTARNCGDIELVFEARRKNNLKVVLLMDVGGSMMPYTNLVSRLFSAAKKSYHFKEFKHYYFHNTIYEYLYENMAQEIKYETAKFLKEYESDWRVILVGDASMHPYELEYKTGGLYIGEGLGFTSIQWLQRLQDHFEKIVWLNPVRLSQFHAESIDIIAKIFPMYELTLQGLDSAIKDLV